MAVSYRCSLWLYPMAQWHDCPLSWLRQHHLGPPQMVIVLGVVGFAALEVWVVETCAAARPAACRLVAFGTMFRCCRLSKHLNPFCQTLICQILKKRNNLLLNLFSVFSAIYQIGSLYWTYKLCWMKSPKCSLCSDDSGHNCWLPQKQTVD